MRISREDLVFLIALVYGCCILSSAKTAPEFTVTVDTPNFKEVRVPLHLWKEIIRQTVANQSLAKDLLNGTKVEDENVMAIEDITNEVSVDVVIPVNAMKPDEAIQEMLQAAEMANEIERPVPTGEDFPAESLTGIVTEELDPVQAVEDTPGEVLVQTSKSPCKCVKGICSCCSTFFRQSTCAKIGFLPDEFSIDLKMTMNDRVIASRKMPIRDPPPFCFNPRRYEFMDLCVQLNNIHYKERNLHMCIDIDAGMGGFDLYSWNYNCLRFGPKGLETGLKPATVTKKPFKPETSGLFNLGSSSSTNSDDDDDDDDDGGLFDVFDDDDDDDDY